MLRNNSWLGCDMRDDAKISKRGSNSIHSVTAMRARKTSGHPNSSCVDSHKASESSKYPFLMMLVPGLSLEVVQAPFPLRWYSWHFSIFKLSHLEQVRETLHNLIRVPLMVSYKVSYLIFPS
jgi:hypothetical protein